MDLQQTYSILKAVTGTYPVYYAKLGTDELKNMVRIWQAVFQGYTYEQVQAGTVMYIRSDSSGYPPSPGQIIDCIDKLYPIAMGEDEAWVLVSKAMRNSGYHAAEEFGRLPEEVRMALVSPMVLRDLASGSPSEARRQFGYSYRRTLEKIRFESRIPMSAMPETAAGPDCLGKPAAAYGLSESTPAPENGT